MIKKKFMKIIAIAMLSVLALNACAASKKDFSGATEPQTSYDTDAAPGNYNGESGGAAVVEEKAEAPKEAAMPNTSSISSNIPEVQTQDKIIKRVSMVVETQNFDDLLITINDKIEVLGGYVESSSINGRRYYYLEESRQARIVARIPKDRLDEFTGTVEEAANVVNSELNTENVTLQYVDMESRKKALQIEQDRLFALLEKEDTLEDIITLERRLSDIRYELQNYESQLRTLDNKVEYSTVTMTIHEVERITPRVEEKKTVWKRIQNGFSDTIYHISEGAKDFIVWFVVNLPYLIIWGGIITVVLLIVRRTYRKKKANIIPKDTPEEKETNS
ncbi:MAG: DUF4349 domain-containing protein [Clostridiales bacterium]|nr:DUF4349 domain-containing protein [Clostridiales bacterium]